MNRFGEPQDSAAGLQYLLSGPTIHWNRKIGSKSMRAKVASMKRTRFSHANYLGGLIVVFLFFFWLMKSSRN